MSRKHLIPLALLWLLLASGCPLDEQAQPSPDQAGTRETTKAGLDRGDDAGSASPDKAGTPKAAKGDGAAKPAVAQPVANMSAISAAQKTTRRGDFGLPLEYTIEVPEVPESIRGPVPPAR